MKPVLAALWILSVAAAFGLARMTGPAGEYADLRSLDSFRAALEARDPLTRSHRFGAFLDGLGPDGLPEALEALEERQRWVSAEEVRLFLLAWGRFDAPAAWAWARDWPTRWNSTLTTEAIYAWGFHDGKAALRAIEEVEEADRRERLRHSLLSGWIRGDDREGVGEFIAGIPDGRRRNRLTGFLAGETRKDGVEVLMAWAEGVPEDSAIKGNAFFHASKIVAQGDPRRAAEWFEAHRTRPYSNGALEGIGRSWVDEHDPVAFFEWAQGLTPMKEREKEFSDAFRVGVRSWRRRAPEEAEAWLRPVLPHPDFDSAVEVIVRSLAQSSPSEAADWALLIQEEEQRRRSLQMASRVWYRRNPEAFDAWLAKSGLPDDWRQSILAGVPAIAQRPAAGWAAEPATP
jgi:hypothetical protein